MTQYFAMINDGCQGPFPLDQLVEAGVTPDTYVWSKKMSDWEKAIDVEEVRDYFQAHLKKKSQVRSGVIQNTSSASSESDPDSYKPKFLRFGMEFPMPEEQVDYDQPPTSHLILAIIITVMCFPFTGFMAIYYSLKSQREWENAMRGNSKDGRVVYTSEEITQLKKDAHYSERMAKMWIGITFFIGLIAVATVLFQQ